MTSLIQPVVTLQALDQQCKGVRAEFFRTGAYYTHRIVGIGADGATATLLESVDGETTQPWPKSPALQELNTNDRATMLVGKAGDGHWSLAIESLADAAQPGLLFDVACRVKSLPPNLTSTYRIAEDVRASPSDATLKLNTPTGDYLLEVIAVDAGVTQGPCQLGLSGNLLEIRQEPPWPGPVPTTIRWQYRLRRLSRTR